MSILKYFAILFIAIQAVNTTAAGLNALENFLKSTQSGKAEFSQVVTSPAKTEAKSDSVEKSVAKVKTSSGSFEFSRPNKFKFLYKKPFEQTIVADGTTLWLFDVDLNQVTARKQAQALGSTPAALIATAASLKALEAEFKLQEAPDVADGRGLQWVLATPKAKDGQIQSIKVGLKGAAETGISLSVLEILDSFGQRSVITFANVERNLTFGSENFSFKPPAGADVIRQ
ncbi:MAG: outer rane lipoprotein carrier protein LolA [Pseudomonadota bacterium]